MPTGAVVAGAVASMYGARQARRGNREAAKLADVRGREAFRREGEAETRAHEEYDREQAENQRRWEAEQAQILEDRRAAEVERVRNEEDRQRRIAEDADARRLLDEDRRTAAEERRIAEEDRRRRQELENEDRRLRDQDRARAEEERQRTIQAWNEREARLGPARAAGAGAFAELARLAGQPNAPPASLTGPRPMPTGWTPSSTASSARASSSAMQVAPSTASMDQYAASLPITRDPAIAQQLESEIDPLAEEPMGGSLASMRQRPEQDAGYVLDNPSSVSPEAYRRLVMAQGESIDPDTLPLSQMRQPGSFGRRRPLRPLPRSA